MKKSIYQVFKDKTKQSIARLNKEKRNIYNVSFNEKDSTLIDAELEFIENAIIDYVKDYSFYYVKGYHNQKLDKGFGAHHIKLHLEKGSEGEITIEELLNLGNSIREYLKIFKEPFTQESQSAKIYEWEDDKGVRFRAITDKKNLDSSISPRHTSISQAYTLTNQGTEATSIAETIITFYSDRNLNKPMEFKNPKLREYYEKQENENSDKNSQTIKQRLKR